ncbi:MAG TPA: biotin/lipoyl-containing protein [Acidobacteriaceae bacterium]|nr:biotin/lipoyl-containing protein [Acidobacteriaceae bacterium]
MTLHLEIGGRTCQVEVDPADTPGQWRIRVDGQPVEADAHLIRPGVLSLLIAGQSFRVVLDPNTADPALHIGHERIPYRVDDPRSLRSRRRLGGVEGPVTLKASMPGRVVRVLVEKGDTVAAHQGVLVVEAMKMQNEMQSPRDGRVRELRVAPGDTVSAGDILAIIE